DLPEGAAFIPEMPGTAPGLVCPLGAQVIYAVPGVPHEMRTMVGATVLADLKRRAGLRAVIRSRVLRTWGHTESGLAELLAGRIAELDALGNPTLAFQASGIEGLKVRITAKAGDDAAAEAMLADEEARVRALVGDVVFGVDGETMESVVLAMLAARGLSLAVAEQLSAGLVAMRLTAAANGADGTFRGGVVTAADGRASELLGAPPGPAVSAEAAAAMAERVRALFGTDVGLATCGVAGPEPQDGHRPGTAFLGLALGNRAEATEARLPGDRDRIRQYAVISVLNALRRRLAAAQ
ncbi:MAG TPA: CinA family protein, partial [Alphaproteobacteria bacterium]